MCVRHSHIRDVYLFVWPVYLCVHKGCRHVVREMIDRCIAHHRRSTVHFSDYSQCAQWVYSSMRVLLLALALSLNLKRLTNMCVRRKKEQKKKKKVKQSAIVILHYGHKSLLLLMIDARERGSELAILPTGYEN